MVATRAIGAVQHVLDGAQDKKIAGLGRGEIMLISQMLLAGRQSADAEFLHLARDVVLACNKVALDGYDTPQFNGLEQIGFSLRELARRMGCGPMRVSEIVRGKRSITAETSILLGRALGVEAAQQKFHSAD